MRLLSTPLGALRACNEATTGSGLGSLRESEPKWRRRVGGTSGVPKGTMIDATARFGTAHDVRRGPPRADRHGRDAHLSRAAVGAHLRCVGAAAGCRCACDSGDRGTGGLVRSDGAHVAGGRSDRGEWRPVLSAFRRRAWCNSQFLAHRCGAISACRAAGRDWPGGTAGGACRSVRGRSSRSASPASPLPSRMASRIDTRSWRHCRRRVPRSRPTICGFWAGSASTTSSP